MIEKMADSLLLLKHSMQFLALFLLLSAYNIEMLLVEYDFWQKWLSLQYPDATLVNLFPLVYSSAAVLVPTTNHVVVWGFLYSHVAGPT